MSVPLKGPAGLSSCLTRVASRARDASADSRIRSITAPPARRRWPPPPSWLAGWRPGRGRPTPSRFSALTSSSMVVVAGRPTTGFAVLARVDGGGPCPRRSGPAPGAPGCDTKGVWVMAMERPPWATATSRMRTPWPATTVPVRSLTTMRARWSGSTSSASIWASKATALALEGGRDLDLDPGGIQGLGRLLAQRLVDGVGDPGGGGEVRAAQAQQQRLALQVGRDRALDRGRRRGRCPRWAGSSATRDPAGRHVVAARLHRALGQRVDRAVGAGQRRDQQDARPPASGRCPAS